MADEQNEQEQQSQENTAGERPADQERVLATGASGDPNDPEAGVPGYIRAANRDVVTPPAPGETDKVVPEPQEPVDPAQPTDTQQMPQGAAQPVRVNNREKR